MARRKYRDCQRQDGNCTLCDLVQHGLDCHNNPISKLEWARLGAEMSMKELAEKSGVPYITIAKVEGGTAQAGNLTAKNLLAMADALSVDPRELI